MKYIIYLLIILLILSISYAGFTLYYSDNIRIIINNNSSSDISISLKTEFYIKEDQFFEIQIEKHRSKGVIISANEDFDLIVSIDSGITMGEYMAGGFPPILLGVRAYIINFDGENLSGSFSSNWF